MRLHNRMIRQAFWLDPDLIESLDEAGCLLYIGTWQLADDSGCLEYSARLIKAHLFPTRRRMTEARIEQYLERMIELGKLIGFEVGDRRYLFIRSFHRHQVLRNAGSPSTPLPPWVEFIPSDNPRRGGRYIVDEEALSQYCDGTVTVHHSISISVSNSHRDGGVGEEGYSAEFEEFWKTYPRCVEKRSAYTRWNARLKEVPASERPGRIAAMLTAAAGYAEHCRADRTEQKFIKHPSTFLGPTRPFEEWAVERRRLHERPANPAVNRDLYDDPRI